MKAAVLKDFTKLTWEHLYRSLFLYKVAGLRHIYSDTGVLLWIFCEIFKNISFTEHIRATACVTCFLKVYLQENAKKMLIQKLLRWINERLNFCL